jgi:hypothetical protein
MQAKRGILAQKGHSERSEESQAEIAMASSMPRDDFIGLHRHFATRNK